MEKYLTSIEKNEQKLQKIISLIKNSQVENFTGSIQLNFDKGTINNRINKKYSEYLLDKE